MVTVTPSTASCFSEDGQPGAIRLTVTMTDWAMRPTRPQAGLATLIDMRPTTGSSGCGIALLRIEPLWRRTGRTWHTAAWPAGVNSACQLPRGADTGGREGVQRHPPPTPTSTRASGYAATASAPECRRERCARETDFKGGSPPPWRSFHAAAVPGRHLDRPGCCRKGRAMATLHSKPSNSAAIREMSGQVRPRPARPSGHVGSADRRRIVAITCRIVLIECGAIPFGPSE
jgi:hypothetical protein